MDTITILKLIALAVFFIFVVPLNLRRKRQ
jgi:hypothetical protein